MQRETVSNIDKGAAAASLCSSTRVDDSVDLSQQSTAESEAIAETAAKTEGSDSFASAVISDEFLRHRIRELIADKPPLSLARRIIEHPLFGTFVQFVLTGVLSVVIVALVNAHLQRLSARRSFSDELNKMRVQRFGEVWERLDENEFLIDRILDDSSRQDSNTDQDVQDIHKLIHEDLAIISKNRFWLGDDVYLKIRTYLDLNIQYALNKLIVTSGTDLTDLVAKRDRAKQDIQRIKSMFLEREDP
jgi:hypothetical protein